MRDYAYGRCRRELSEHVEFHDDDVDVIDRAQHLEGPRMPWRMAIPESKVLKILLRDVANLRTFNRHIREQALLTEHDADNRFFHRVRIDRSGRTGAQHRDTGIGPDFPT